jgi:hypothetical protein
MAQRKPSERPTPPSLPHRCPVCHEPQTKIQRSRADSGGGSINYVCTRVAQCAVAIDLAQVSTWTAV